MKILELINVDPPVTSAIVLDYDYWLINSRAESATTRYEVRNTQGPRGFQVKVLNPQPEKLTISGFYLPLGRMTFVREPVHYYAAPKKIKQLKGGIYNIQYYNRTLGNYLFVDYDFEELELVPSQTEGQVSLRMPFTLEFLEVEGDLVLEREPIV